MKNINIKYTNLILLVFSIVLLQHCGDDSSSTTASIQVIKDASGLEMVLIPGGTFVMGKDGGNPDEGPSHEVTVSPFVMDRREVIQRIYEELMLSDPSHFKGSDNPVEQVRWSDAAMFCNARSQVDGLEPCYDELSFACNFQASGYRLPTEAEWEYACRAGSSTDYDFGGDPQKLASRACYANNSNKRTLKTGSRKPNAFGLYDMHGNVFEWCYDVYDVDYYKNSPKTDPRGPAAGKERVLRGGAWNSSAEACRSSYRVSDVPGITDACFAQDTYGFRCVRRLSDKELALLAQ